MVRQSVQEIVILIVQQYLELATQPLAFALNAKQDLPLTKMEFAY